MSLKSVLKRRQRPNAGFLSLGISPIVNNDGAQTKTYIGSD